MSALGKVYGDFDSNGQLVEGRATPADRVIERSVIVTRTVTETPPPAPLKAAPPEIKRPLQASPEARRPPMTGPLAPKPQPSDLVLDRARDDLLTPFGKATLRDRYLLEGESFQDMFARVSCAYADDIAHAQRLYDAMSQLWFMPATLHILSMSRRTIRYPSGCRNVAEDKLPGQERLPIN